MSSGQSIGDREREILTALVETFISTGEPVGSRMLSRSSREGLSPATIRNVMADLADAGFMERTSHVLSLISRNVGVAVAASGPKNALEHVYFSRLGDQKVLAVLVTKSGVVRDRVLRLDLPQSDLDLASRYINENFRGWTMESVRSELARRLEQERGEYDRLMNSIEQLYR